MRSDEQAYQRALLKEREYSEYVTRFTTLLRAGAHDCDEACELRKAILACVPEGLYEHFKSTEEDQKYYYVLGVKINVEHKDERAVEVIYRALYGDRNHELAGRDLTGHKDCFLRPINRPGYIGPRFRKASDEEEKDFFFLYF